jgi:hypothetical protein
MKLKKINGLINIKIIILISKIYFFPIQIN